LRQLLPDSRQELPSSRQLRSDSRHEFPG
jgi:hypothetical protein